MRETFSTRQTVPGFGFRVYTRIKKCMGSNLRRYCGYIEFDLFTITNKLAAFNKITRKIRTDEENFTQTDVLRKKAGDKFSDGKINKEVLKQLKSPQIT